VFPPSTSVFPCQCHSINAPYSPSYYNFLTEGQAGEALNIKTKERRLAYQDVLQVVTRQSCNVNTNSVVQSIACQTAVPAIYCATPFGWLPEL